VETSSVIPFDIDIAKNIQTLATALEEAINMETVDMSTILNT
jgi:hypothetical protein